MPLRGGAVDETYIENLFRQAPSWQTLCKLFNE